MKSLYIECNMGAAGDMLMSALSELIDDADGFVKRFNALGIEGVTLERQKSVKCGITGTHMTVKVNGIEENENMHHHEHHEHAHEHHHEHHHEHTHEHHHEHTHHHSSMRDVEHIIHHLNVSNNVKRNAAAVYKLIAEAESHAHDKPIDEIHFHEIGTMDAIADVVGVCMLMDELSPDTVIVSPIHVGSGTVKCAHGILPVPAPATSYILKDVPVYGGEIKGELCTPTGAALLKHFADKFGAMPVMRISKTGYGMGTKDFPAANCIRAMLGETEHSTDTIAELICNIDDMTGEEIGFATELLLNAGAADVFTTPINMKKNRPGIMLTCMCREEQRDEILKLIFKYTSTIGVREHISNRYVLKREETTVTTKYGEVRAKTSSGYGVSKTKLEYEDLSKLAKENGISIREID